jgi:hypothetical protein
MIRPFAQNIWDLRPPVSVEFRRGQHEKAWAPPNTLGRIYWRAYYTQKQREGALLIRAPEDGEKKNLPAPTVRRGLISISVITPCFQ